MDGQRPQTNEVRRSAALIAAGHLLAQRFGLPLALSELGASGGLNLMWDHFALCANGHVFGPEDATVQLVPEWTGPLPPADKPRVVERRGVDLNPINTHDPTGQLRPMAYLWPDQAERLTLTRAAIALQDAPVDCADAIDWLASRLPPRPGQCHLIYHTIAWQYFPTEAQTRGRALIEAAGVRATADTPLAWLSMENDNADVGAAVTLRCWPGGDVETLGRADFHGRWMHWT